jgi:hypothetical protein
VPHDRREALSRRSWGYLREDAARFSPSFKIKGMTNTDTQIGIVAGIIAAMGSGRLANSTQTQSIAGTIRRIKHIRITGFESLIVLPR